MTIFDVDLAVLRQRTSMKWTRYAPDVLPLWVAEMDCVPAPGIQKRLRRAVEIGDFGYPGYDSLPAAYGRFARDVWGLELDRRQVMPCADVVTGMAVLVERLAPEGSSVVINPPVYPPFRVSGSVRGRRLLEVPMTAAGRLDPAALGEAFARPEVSTYLLCSPHNPHGTVHTADELGEVARLARAHDVRVISDEIHAPLVAPGVTFTSYLAVPGSENAYLSTSASKSFNLPALKAGLLVAGPEVVEEMWSFPYEVRAGSSHLGLMLQAAALDDDRDWLGQLNDEIVEHKQLLAALLPQVGLSYDPSAGTYLAWVDAAPLGFANPAAELVERGRVAFNAGTDYSPAAVQWVRINLATSPEIITEAVRRIQTALG